MPTLQQLRTACAVAEAGFNLSRAAELLHTTQPAVSKTIKTIESELGAAVFVRSSTRITGLTALGENVTELARNMMRDSAAISELARENSKTTRGVLKIGTSHTCARYVLRNGPGRQSGSALAKTTITPALKRALAACARREARARLQT